MSSGPTRERIRKAYAYIRDEGLEEPDCLLLLNSTEPHLDLSFFYLSSLSEGLFEGCAFLARADGTAVLFTSPLEEEIARRERGDYRIAVFRGKKELHTLLLKELGSPRGLRVAINAAELTYEGYAELRALLRGARFVDVSKALRRARMVKDEVELEAIRRACQIASAAYARAIEAARDGIAEHELAAELCYWMQKQGASSPAFEPIVAFGANSALPHHASGSTRLEKGHVVLLDYGAKYRRYNSDITRTFFFGGPRPELRRMYEVVLEANRIGIEALSAGVSAAQVHNKVADFIEATEFKGRFVHSTGHGLGLAVHDPGRLHTTETFVVEEGMVFTVEPGVYVPGVGGVRIEDVVVARRGGREVLTTAPKDLTSV